MLMFVYMDMSAFLRRGTTSDIIFSKMPMTQVKVKDQYSVCKIGIRNMSSFLFYMKVSKTNLLGPTYNSG